MTNILKLLRVLSHQKNVFQGRGQTTDESYSSPRFHILCDLERQECGCNGHIVQLVRRQGFGRQSIHKDELDNTLHESKPARGNQHNHRWECIHISIHEQLHCNSDNYPKQPVRVRNNRLTNLVFYRNSASS